MTEIVLIDDSTFDLTINEMVIRKSIDRNCIKFINPREGFEFIKQKLESSDERILLFLDLNMPELNGWQLLELLRRCPENTLSKINIIILSNSDNPTDIANSKKYKMVNSYTTKPLNADKLKAAMSYVLN